MFSSCVMAAPPYLSITHNESGRNPPLASELGLCQAVLGGSTSGFPCFSSPPSSPTCLRDGHALGPEEDTVERGGNEQLAKGTLPM